ncbi:hypothetical protein ANAPC5_01466 [Anaplasma phagocytophilum]|nr:hypothetical protein ANAPC5_01466 [Anaplasma phagocytophilum]
MKKTNFFTLYGLLLLVAALWNAFIVQELVSIPTPVAPEWTFHGIFLQVVNIMAVQVVSAAWERISLSLTVHRSFSSQDFECCESNDTCL